MDGYKAVVAASWKPLSVKEKIMYKETDGMNKLDEVIVPDGSLVLSLANYITISVDNPKAENNKYNQYVVVSEDGEAFVTSSDTFDEAINSVLDEITDLDANEIGEWQLKIYKRESKNYKGKYFLTCTII